MSDKEAQVRAWVEKPIATTHNQYVIVLLIILGIDASFIVPYCILQITFSVPFMPSCLLIAWICLTIAYILYDIRYLRKIRKLQK